MNLWLVCEPPPEVFYATGDIKSNTLTLILRFLTLYGSLAALSHSRAWENATFAQRNLQ